MIFSIVALVLRVALTIFFVLMWVRFGFDWARVLAPRWRPTGPLLVLAEVSYTVTDPPIRAVRRVVPPLRLGGAVLDLAWSIVLLLCFVGFSLVAAIGSLG
ncbi:YggT family protein [uncultured Schumannella sp.]|uniref:YggT family protein n=1 Tax=uncultured Schumannella sp. TaxID=1195956 RepID=UPI0025F2BF17|nr:YggT family protein [uncultured Schumannella sp.]